MDSSSVDFAGSSGPQFDLPRSARSASREYRHRLQAVYESPMRLSQPVLDPTKANRALWIGIDDSVTNFIRYTWQGNFWGPWKNWYDVKSKAPEKIQAWWGTFVQNYYWDPSIEDLVFFEWKEKTEKGIGEDISRHKRAGKQPSYISTEHWTMLLEEWQTEKAILRSQKAAISRSTSIDGKGMHKHTAGPKSFAKIEYELRQQAPPSTAPSILDIVKKMHTHDDGTYVDKVVEGIVKEVEEEATHHQASPGTVGSTSGRSRDVLNQLYVKRTKPRYGHIYEVGSARTQFFQPEEYQSQPFQSQPHEDLHGRIDGLDTRMGRVEGKMDFMVDTVEELRRFIMAQGTSSRSQLVDNVPSPTADDELTPLHNVRLDFDDDP